MVHGKKLSKETLLLPSLDDNDTMTESDKLLLEEVGGRPFSQVCKLSSKGSVEETYRNDLMMIRSDFYET